MEEASNGFHSSELSFPINFRGSIMTLRNITIRVIGNRSTQDTVLGSNFVLFSCPHNSLAYSTILWSSGCNGTCRGVNTGFTHTIGL